MTDRNTATSPNAEILIHVFIDLSFLRFDLHFVVYVLMLTCFSAPLSFKFNEKNV